MSWRAVAEKDFRDAIRSRWLWALSGLFVLLFSTPGILRFYFGVGDVEGQEAEAAGGIVVLFIHMMKEMTALLVPIIAIVIAYAALTRERETGTMKLLLSLPHDRYEVVFGKLLGRSAVIAIPILVGFAVCGLFLLPAATGFAVGRYVGFAVLTALLGVVFVGISVGISAAANSQRQAMVGTVGTYVGFLAVWNPLTGELAEQSVDLVGGSERSRYLIELFLTLLNPMEAYKTLADSLVFESALQARQAAFGFFLFPDPAAIEALGDDLPIVFTDPFVVVYLLLWLVVPITIGMYVFERRDL